MTESTQDTSGKGSVDTETYDVIAATGCPTGIAHTYMAKEALKRLRLPEDFPSRWKHTVKLGLKTK